MEYIGIIELQGDDNEYHDWHVCQDGDALVYGSATNTGLLEEGRLSLRPEFGDTVDSALAELLEILQEKVGYPSQPDCE